MKSDHLAQELKESIVTSFTSDIGRLLLLEDIGLLSGDKLVISVIKNVESVQRNALTLSSLDLLL